VGVLRMNISRDQEIELANVRALLFQRERELRELHHRIANSLQLASTFLIFQKKKFDDPDVKAGYETAAMRLAAVGKLHRHLYAHSAASQVDFKEFLEELCPEIANSTGLHCAVEADPIIVSGEMAQNLAIVINEFAMNASKHGYDGQEGGRLKIESRRERDRLRLVVADGGKGLGDSFDPNGGKGLGMSVVNSIVAQLSGTLRADDDHGARFTLTAPLA
jgi:two-component sensor histidine kinase